MITGVYRPTKGSIDLARRPIVGLEPHQIAHAGIARTFQNIRLFPSLTVSDNVRVGFRNAAKSGLVGSVLQFGKYQAEEAQFTKEAEALLDMFGLLDKKSE